MCITTPLQQNIIDRTEEGDTIAEFLVDTMRGETPGVKVCHRMDAAKHLIKYGFPDTECDAAPIHPESVEGRAKNPSPSRGKVGMGVITLPILLLVTWTSSTTR